MKQGTSRESDYERSNSSLSDDGNLSSSSSSYGLEPGEKEESVELAATEARWIRRSKYLVALVLILGTTICAFSVYTFISQQEQNDFTTQFESIGHSIIDVSQITADNVFETVRSMSTTVTSFAIATNASWPFVTIPDFVARGTQLLKLSGSFYVALTPIIQPHQRLEWEKYALENQGWLLAEQPGGVTTGPPPGGDRQGLQGEQEDENDKSFGIYPFIWEGSFASPEPVPDRNSPYGPFWQVSPPIPFAVNQDIFAISDFDKVYDAMNRNDDIVLSRQFQNSRYPADDERGWPTSYITSPIHATFSPGSEIVAVFAAVLPWHKYFSNTVPPGLGGLIVVVKNTCNQSSTYVADGEVVKFLGNGDRHDPRFSHLEIYDHFNVLLNQASNETDSDGTCKYSLSVYPTNDFYSNFVTNEPFYYTAGVVLIFSLTSLVFLLYDCLVKRKDQKLMNTATNTNEIVNGLFPATVRDRLMADAIERRNQRQQQHTTERGGLRIGDKNSIYSETESHIGLLLKTKPIADLFPNSTVMFADISGFTAWASSREPSQVFILLEQIYGSFDALAKSRDIFKVETTGDCYVAAAGLPNPRPDHAVAMVRFARDCLNEMNQNVHKLEILLGPDTAELSMRIGLHSGPVTGGVLRGEKSRFQLFGDTVNMASRIESTGVRNRIHVSQETANYLIEQGKDAWLTPRKDPIFVKGKGEVQTYWVDFPRTASIRSETARRKSSSDLRAKPGPRNLTMKTERLIEWNVSVLQGLLKKIVAMRPPLEQAPRQKNQKGHSTGTIRLRSADGDTVLDEVKEIIELPRKVSAYKQDPDAIELDSEVVSQLRMYVTSISNMYRDNPFHNFEHASHVTQSVTKLMSRVVTPDSIDYNDLSYVKTQKISQLHEYTYGITSDPLTQFACAFSALIHDVDHTGVPNATLIKEDGNIARKYKNKSVAEQNSVDLAWELLEDNSYNRLRETIYSNESELYRFRQLVVNSVMATDIADKELGTLRKNRWNKAFNLDNGPALSGISPEEDANRKATIVIEHLIQASDVSHTMQHWHVYLKWNERLFREMYKAFLAGRLENDPSEGWYQGELGFFDFYLIPLGKKLKECGVFGVSSDEYLNYAMANRKEWEQKGKDVVARYIESFHASMKSE